MRIRMMSSTGDMQFGKSQGNFQANTPAAVAQLVQTRLGLWAGQWFMDVTDGVPWATDVLGNRTTPVYNAAIKSRILGTDGVDSISNYTSNLNNRNLAIQCTVITDYGPTTITFGG